MLRLCNHVSQNPGPSTHRPRVINRKGFSASPCPNVCANEAGCHRGQHALVLRTAVGVNTHTREHYMVTGRCAESAELLEKKGHGIISAANTCACTNILLLTCAHTHTSIHVQTHKHVHIHTHMHIHVYMHTHIHLLPCIHRCTRPWGKSGKTQGTHYKGALQAQALQMLFRDQITSEVPGGV